MVVWSPTWQSLRSCLVGRVRTPCWVVDPEPGRRGPTGQESVDNRTWGRRKGPSRRSTSGTTLPERLFPTGSSRHRPRGGVGVDRKTNGFLPLRRWEVVWRWRHTTEPHVCFCPIGRSRGLGPRQGLWPKSLRRTSYYGCNFEITRPERSNGKDTSLHRSPPATLQDELHVVSPLHPVPTCREHLSGVETVGRRQQFLT